MSWRMVKQDTFLSSLFLTSYISEDIGDTHFGGFLRKKQKISETEDVVKVMIICGGFDCD